MTALDIRLRADFWDHYKTKKLEKRTGGPVGPKHLQILWLWARGARTDGDLSGMTTEDIELQAKWPGEDGALVRALVDVGFLDGEEGSYRLHDWEDEQPWAKEAAARSESARKAARTKWERIRNGESPAPQSGSDAPAMRPQSGRSADAPSAQSAETETYTETKTPPPARAHVRDAGAPPPDGGGGGGDAAPPEEPTRKERLEAVSAGVEREISDDWPGWDESSRRDVRVAVAFAFPLESRAIHERPVETLVRGLVAIQAEVRRTTTSVTSPKVCQKRWRAQVCEWDEELAARDRHRGSASSPAPGVAAGQKETPGKLDPSDRSDRVEVLHARKRCGGAGNGCFVCLDDMHLNGKLGAARA